MWKFAKDKSFILYTSSKTLIHVILKINNIVDKREPTSHVGQMKKLGIERSLVGPGLVSSLLRTESTLPSRPLYFKSKVCKPTTYSCSSLIVKEHVTPENSAWWPYHGRCPWSSQELKPPENFCLEVRLHGALPQPTFAKTIWHLLLLSTAVNISHISFLSL